MNEHVTHWLGAYHDDELSDARRRQAEAHLAECQACRDEMARIQALSGLLALGPVARDLTPPDRFQAQVALRLPRRSERISLLRALELCWRAVPIGLMGAWAVVQAVFVVSALVGLALAFNLGAEGLVALFPAPAGNGWLASVVEMLPIELGGAAWIALLIGAWFLVYHLMLLEIGLMCWSWLSSWWVYRQRSGQIVL